MIFEGSTGAKYVARASGTVLPFPKMMASPSRRPQAAVPLTATRTVLTSLTTRMVISPETRIQQ